MKSPELSETSTKRKTSNYPSLAGATIDQLGNTFYKAYTPACVKQGTHQAQRPLCKLCTRGAALVDKTTRARKSWPGGVEPSLDHLQEQRSSSNEDAFPLKAGP